MICPSTLPPTDRFLLIVRCLCASVIGRESVLSRALTMAICERMTRISVLFTALVARVRAGKPFVARGPRGPRAVRPDAMPADPAAPPAYVRPKLPRGFAWLLPLVPGAANFGSQLTYLLEDPEMAAWVSASPGLVRLLRPMCRMLGVNPLPALLASPPRVRRAKPAQAKARKPKRRPAYPRTAVLGGFEYHAPRRRGGFSRV